MAYKCKNCGQPYITALSVCLNRGCDGEIIYVDSAEELEQRAPGLPRCERPHLFKYLARRRSDGTHWIVYAMNWARKEALLIDFKDPDAKAVSEPFSNLDLVDKADLDGPDPAAKVA